jgi:hypothetical protein
MLPPMIPAELSPGELTDLLIAWAAGEVSEGRLAELTGLDRTSLRGMLQNAIKRGEELAKSDRSRSALWHSSRSGITTDPPNSSAGSTAELENPGS